MEAGDGQIGDAKANIAKAREALSNAANGIARQGDLAKDLRYTPGEAPGSDPEAPTSQIRA